MEQLRLMASRHSVFYTPLLGVIAGGFLKEEGLEASYSPATPEKPAISEVINRNADVAQSAVSGSWSFLDKGARPPIAHFAQINRFDGFFIAGRSPDGGFEWDKLSDGNVLYVHGGQPEAMLRYALHKKGINPADVSGPDLPDDTELMMRKWREGLGDFFHEQGSYPQQLEYEGEAHVLASVGEAIGPVAFSSLCCRWQWLDTDAAKRFTAAFRRSREWANTAPSRDIASAISDFFPNHSIEAIMSAVDSYQKLGTWNGDIAIELPLYEKALDVFEYSGLIDKRHPFDKVVVPPPV